MDGDAIYNELIDHYPFSRFLLEQPPHTQDLNEVISPNWQAQFMNNRSLFKRRQFVFNLHTLILFGAFKMRLYQIASQFKECHPKNIFATTPRITRKNIECTFNTVETLTKMTRSVNYSLSFLISHMVGEDMLKLDITRRPTLIAPIYWSGATIKWLRTSTLRICRKG